jgi:hypothetical protein
MRRSRACRALLLTVFACLLAAAPALAAPDRGEGAAPGAERPAWTDEVRDAVISLWERLRIVVGGEEPNKTDRTPGSGLDPDGWKAKTE